MLTYGVGMMITFQHGFASYPGSFQLFNDARRERGKIHHMHHVEVGRDFARHTHRLKLRMQKVSGTMYPYINFVVVLVHVSMSVPGDSRFLDPAVLPSQ